MFSNPQNNVERFGLILGTTVVDLGSGTGEYSLEAARIVGGGGKVYAVDVQKDLLSRLKQRADEASLRNIEILWGDVEKLRGTGLQDESVDAVILANIMFQVEDIEGLIKETLRILRPKGRIFIVDWQESFGGMGPQISDVINSEKAQELFSAHGCQKISEFDAGEHHYGLIFEKQI